MDRNRRAIRERILNSRKQAERAAEELHAAEHISKDILHECLMDYVLSKFSLSRDQCNTESFNEITELSIEKSLEISKELLQEAQAVANDYIQRNRTKKKRRRFRWLSPALCFSLGAGLTGAAWGLSLLL